MSVVHIPTVEQSAARADALQRVIEHHLEGHSHEVVICVCASLLSQAIANLSESPEQAHIAVDRYAAAIKADIEKNWHLVTARRKRG